MASTRNVELMIFIHWSRRNK